MILPEQFWELDCVASPRNDYRLWLSRTVHVTGGMPIPDHRMLVYGMLNPSKARGVEQGDPTQRKCDGFTKRLDRWRYGIVNLFAQSTPYPEDLFEFGYESAVGPFNDQVTRRVMELCKARGWPFVAAWGTCSKLSVAEKGHVSRRVQQWVSWSREIGLTIYCLEATLDGTPRHPLMLGYEHSKLLHWDDPA